MLRKKFQKPGAPTFTPSPELGSLGSGVLGFPWAAFPPLSSFLFYPRSKKQRQAGGGDGRTQTRSSGLSQPSLPWRCCYFYLVVHDAQSPHFLCSREARRALPSPFNAAPSPRGKGVMEGRGTPWVTPPPGDCLGWLALHLGTFWFPASAPSFIFSGSNSPRLPETLLQSEKERLLQTRFPRAETPALPWENQTWF
uniref:Uncharacterized protein n=1 Tax=Myotis myotis TaxID=51298 RepID=A0A7J7SR65_MYOMY|nr:hypothetical protein mMyoMyo1_009318 [Myotis myotis]